MQFSARLPSRVWLRLAGAALALIALLSWGLSTAIGGTPDEDFHLVSTWCGGGLRDGVCEAGSTDLAREVPSSLLKATCFAFHADASAACQGDALRHPTDEMEETVRGNMTGLYPRVFYSVMNVFVGPDVDHSVLVMRVFNALLFVVFVGVVYWAVPVGLRRGVLVGSVVAAVPFGMFLIPSLNPSSWAYLSAATLLATVVGFVRTDERRRMWVLGVLAGLATLVGAGARGDAAMYAVVAIVAAAIIAVRPRRAWVRLWYPAVLAVIAGLQFLTTGQAGAVDQAGADQQLTLWNVLKLLNDVPVLWAGDFGLWSLGWIDTGVPALVWVFAGSIFAAVVFAGLGGIRARQGIAVAMIGLAAWFVPAYIQFAWNAPVGSEVQPRYILPLLVMLAVAATIRLRGPAFRLGGIQRWVVVLGLGIANAVALHVNMRRYISGDDVPSLNLNNSLEWWWDLPVGPMAVWLVGSAAFVAGLALLTRELTEDAAAVTTTEELESAQPEPGEHAETPAALVVPAATESRLVEPQVVPASGGPVEVAGRSTSAAGTADGA